jgi:hypothetical protein
MKERNKARVDTSGLMVVSTKGSGTTTRFMASESIIGVMAVAMKVVKSF